MKRKILGNTELEISALCLGTMHFGTRNDEESSLALLDTFCELGGNFIDTSNNYAFFNKGGHGGESEQVIGNWLKNKGNRNRVIIATKVGAQPINGKLEGLSSKSIEDAIDSSLRRLRTDYIDVYYTHFDDRTADLKETIECLDRLIKSGKVRAIGCSNMLTWRLEKARSISILHHWNKFCCVQQRYTYLRPKPGADFGIQVAVNDELIDYCKANNDITLLPYHVLISGCYTQKNHSIPPQYAWPDSKNRLKILKKIAQRKKATMNQIVFSWIQTMAPSVVPIIGASTIDQLKENVNSLKIELGNEDIKMLNDSV